MDNVKQTIAKRLNKGDVLADGRVVESYAFGFSTHDPDIKVWFTDGTEQIFRGYQEVELQQEPDEDGGAWEFAPFGPF